MDGDIVELSGRTILVTGASSGIGATIAHTLGKAGANVIVHHPGAATEADAKAVARALPGGRAHVVAGDFLTPEGPSATWRDALAWKGRIDVLVNNAGVFFWDAGVDQPAERWDDVWHRTLQVNVVATARITRDAVRTFRAQGGGIVVTIGSYVGQRGVSRGDSMQYAASKGAIKAFMQSVARAHARDGVLVYTIAPGVVRAGQSMAVAKAQGLEEQITKSLVMKEWIPPEDIAAWVAFLATGKARHASGATIEVTGANFLR